MGEFAKYNGNEIKIGICENMYYLRADQAREGPDARNLTLLGIKVARNGFPGPVMVTQQAWRNGKLVTICKCGGCEHPYRLPTLADAEPVIVAIRSLSNDSTGWYHKVADRIASGYALNMPGY